LTENAPYLLGKPLAASKNDTGRALKPLVESTLRLTPALANQQISPAATATSDEFARALHGASRVRSELEEARRQSERRGLHVRDLPGLLRIGVVFAGRELQLEHFSGRARELCGCADDAAFREAWRVLRPVLRRSLDESFLRPHEGGSLLIEVPRPRCSRAAPLEDRARNTS
jgi:hypothetical protein